MSTKAQDHIYSDLRSQIAFSADYISETIDKLIPVYLEMCMISAHRLTPGLIDSVTFSKVDYTGNETKSKLDINSRLLDKEALSHCAMVMVFSMLKLASMGHEFPPRMWQIDGRPLFDEMDGKVEFDYKLHNLSVGEDGRGLYHRKGFSDSTNLEMLLVCIGRINPIKEQLLIASINRYIAAKQTGEPIDESTPALMRRSAQALAELMTVRPNE